MKLFSSFANSKKKNRLSAASSRSDPSPSPSDASTTPRSVLPEGKFTPEEVHGALLRLGSTEDEIALILSEVVHDDDGLVDIESCLAHLGAREAAAAAEEELRAAFAAYDTNGDGKISAEELCEALRDLGAGAWSVEECRRMIVGVDSDGDGMVCFRDFARMLSPDAATIVGS